MVVILNIFILVVSFKEAVNHEKRKPTRGRNMNDFVAEKNLFKTAKRWLKGWVTLMVLVGVTWISGVLYIHASMQWFSYVFIVLNGLQVSERKQNKNL